MKVKSKIKFGVDRLPQRKDIFQAANLSSSWRH